MSRSVGDQLPDSVFEWLYAGRAFETTMWSAVLLVTDPSGYPHPSLAAPVVAVDKCCLYMPIWPNSRSANWARSRPAGTVLLAEEDALWYVKGNLTVGDTPLRSNPRHVALRLDVTEVLEDRLPGTRITSGIRYQLQPGFDEFRTTIAGVCHDLMELAGR